MAQVLNLDDLAAKTEKVLSLKGVKYVMRSMSVQDFIDFSKEAQERELDKAKVEGDSIKEGKEPTEADVSVIAESFIGMIQHSFPDMPEEVVRTLSMDQLGAVVAFARGDEMDDITESGAAGDAGKKPVATKKTKSRT